MTRSRKVCSAIPGIRVGLSHLSETNNHVASSRRFIVHRYFSSKSPNLNSNESAAPKKKSIFEIVKSKKHLVNDTSSVRNNKNQTQNPINTSSTVIKNEDPREIDLTSLKPEFRDALESAANNTEIPSRRGSGDFFKNLLNSKKGSNEQLRKPNDKTSTFSIDSRRVKSPSANIRDILREKNLETPSQNEDALSGSTRNVAASILQGLNKTVDADKDIDDGMVAADVSDEPISAGELRYLQHLENMRIKREQLASQMPQNDSNSRYQKPSTDHSSNKSNAPNKPLTIEDMKLLALERMQKAQVNVQSSSNKDVGTNKIKLQETQKKLSFPHSGVSIRDFAIKASMKVEKVIHELKEIGEYPSVMSVAEQEDFVIDADIAELIALEKGFIVIREGIKVSEIDREHQELRQNIQKTPRAPVVCIMGHVDHGKTTLLDFLRNANVAMGEAGGITQKLSAFTVSLKEGTTENDRKVIFLDTPGHAAFSSMRSSGAEATDVVVLVVAIDDGVRPQTIEALKVAKEAKRTIIVALNKIDKLTEAERLPARVKVLNQLAELDVIAEDFGGDVQVAEISAKQGIGIDKLVESLALQTDVLELTAFPEGPGEAVILNSDVDKRLGVVIDALVKEGKLSVGDCMIVGRTVGRIKNIFNDAGKSIPFATPSTPVRIIGFKEIPQGIVNGENLLNMENETHAKQIVRRRQKIHELRELAASQHVNASAHVVSTDKTLSVAESEDDDKVVYLILKADGSHTQQALDKIISELASRSEEVRVNVIDSSIGNVSVADVERAFSVKGKRKAVILAFNINIANQATKTKMKDLGINVVRETVIYRLEDELKVLMQGTLTKEKICTAEGSAVVLKVFSITEKTPGASSGTKTTSIVAGMRVKTGSMRITTSLKDGEYLYRIKRKGLLIQDDVKATSLKRFKDSVEMVEQGQECGLTLDKFTSFEEGDEVECFKVEFVMPSLKLRNEEDINSDK